MKASTRLESIHASTPFDLGNEALRDEALSQVLMGLSQANSFECYRLAANTYRDRGEFDKAAACYRAAIERFSDCVEGHRELGVIQELARDFDGEVESYRQALRLSSNQPFWLYSTLARLVSDQPSQQSKVEAIELYRKGMEKDPQHADGISYARLARLLSEQGDVDAAILNYQKALTKQPELDWVKYCIESLLYNKGIRYLKDGNLPIAESYFRQINEIKNSWERPVWFCEKEQNWPKFQLDCESQLEIHKHPNTAWPKISIVTPSLNQGEYIEETILSVLNQNYKNVEYIVVDGNSSDDTLKTLRKYQHRFSTLIIEEDTGQSNAINKGFSLATGELFGWLNADDMLAPGALYKIALAYLDSPVDILAGTCVAHREHCIEMVRKPKIKQTDFTLENLTSLELWEQGYFFFQPEVFFSRRIWEDSGGALDEHLHYAMDHALWLKFAQLGATIKIIDWPIALFRKHDRQKTACNRASLEELSQLLSTYRLQVHDTFRSDTKKTIEVSKKSMTFLKANTSLEVIEDLFEEGHWQELVLACQDFVKSHPDKAEGYRWLGIGQEKVGDTHGQLVSYQRSLDLDSSQPTWVYLVLAQLLIEKRQWESAMELLNKALKAYPHNAEAYRWLGFCKEHTGDVNGEIADYRKAIELDPNQPKWVYMVLGKLIETHEDLGGASSSERKKDDSRKIYLGFGDSLLKQDKSNEAVSFYYDILDLKPEFSDHIYERLGDLFSKKQDVDQAERNYLEAIRLRPQDSHLYLKLGDTQNSQGNAEAAFASYCRSLELKPDYLDTLRNLGNLI